MFGIDPTTQAETFLYTPPNHDQRNLEGLSNALINVGNALYGTSYYNGAFSYGSVFKINLATGHYATVHSFSGGSDGSFPAAALLNVGGMAYGTTAGGGASNFGTVFMIDGATGAETVVYSFAGGTDGRTPVAALIDVGGLLYGTTGAGGGGAGCGSDGGGTVFKLDPVTRAETVLYPFACGSDGEGPAAGLVNVGGLLYGTTKYGGGYGFGTVFKINPTTGAETVVYSFGDGGDGQYPAAGLLDVRGTLYGTTSQGGIHLTIDGEESGQGTIFQVNPSTGEEKVIHKFNFTTEGSQPQAGLISVGNALYGTTAYYGPSGGGTVFSFMP